ncbi:MAG: hypothetical protein KKA10_04225 [Euryarchaeota archaeon]|nr:hypothetical protein [Euryarchaeota archaeon]MCG2738130.1 hypothetical protein [Candidatus Methanoperedenaceae archaeon]
MTHKCKSGNHTWLFKEDADKCCNGFRRVLAIGNVGIAPKDCDRVCHEPLPGGGRYGYKWVPV